MMETGTRFSCVLGILIICLTAATLSGSCGDTEIDVLSFSRDYYTPDYPRWSYQKDSYELDMYCFVKFTTSYSPDAVKFTVLETDFPPRDFRGNCGQDRVTFYDGATTGSLRLKVVCGTETPTIESTGQVVLMVFQTGSTTSGKYKGMKFSYETIDHGGLDEYLDIGTYDLLLPICLGIGAFALISIICVTVICCVRCHRRNQLLSALRAPQANVMVNQGQDYNLAMANLQRAHAQPAYPQQQIQVGYSYTPAPTNPTDHGGPPPHSTHPGYAPNYNQQPHHHGQPSQWPPQEVAEPLMPHDPSGAAGLQPSAPPSYVDAVAGTYHS